MADFSRDKGNVVDREALKVGEQKLREIFAILEKIDELINLLSYYNTVEAKKLHDLLVSSRDEFSEIVRHKDEIIQLANDVSKGTFNGRRKLDIDLSLNKKGIAETETNAEALAIWQNQQTTVYYSRAVAYFVDGTNVIVNFTNDDNQAINISTSAEFGLQLNKHTAFIKKMTGTQLTIDAAGRVGNLLRAIDATTESASNIDYIKIIAVSGDFVEKEPAYTWLDTTSAILVLINNLNIYINVIESVKKYEALSLNLDLIADNLDNIIKVAKDIGYIHSMIMDCGLITESIDTTHSVVNAYLNLEPRVVQVEAEIDDIKDGMAVI
jgi:hypothetical protein